MTMKNLQISISNCKNSIQMKKNQFAFAAVIGVFALASCVRDVPEVETTPEVAENSIVFTLQSAPDTRSAEVSSPVHTATYDMGMIEDGQRLFMEETVTTLDGFPTAIPATRGTPAYTENLGVLYKNDLSIYGDKGSFGTVTMESLDEEMYDRKDATEANPNKGWRYLYTYPTNPWPTDGSAVGFYLNMPASPTNVNITNRENGVFTFGYTSPATASAQQDILFAYRTLTKAQHNEFLPNGAPVLFNHALTAVKFAIGNAEADISQHSIAIKEVIIKGLYDGGVCTLTPASESNYTDDKSVHSSATAANWPAASLTASGNPISSGTYESAPVTYGSGEGQVSNFGENGAYPASFASSGNANNLGSADGSQIFWLIPQTITSNVQLTIKYTFDGEEKSFTINDFGATLAAKSVKWQAGELRTYKLTAKEVNVHIEDDIAAVSGKNVKQNVVITNTGNTDAFIRATIIGNWCAPTGEAVFGYTDYTDGSYVPIPSWTIENPGGGVFNGLPGTGWVRGTDGYFYYTASVAPNGTTSALFTSYTPGTPPPFEVAGKKIDAHFVVEIATQAIEAKEGVGYEAAWADTK